LFSSVAEPTTSSSSSTHAHTSLKRYDWNFGCVRLVEDRSTILELMSLAGFVVCATNNDIVPNLLDISLNVKHPLSTSLLFPQYKYSSLMKITLQLATNQYKTN
uniref:RUN domain-containing protein n=1 Tax=Anisakis simplex TaxID=6269 RepID=A0A0M3JJI3_ANISI